MDCVEERGEVEIRRRGVGEFVGGVEGGIGV
jgi:hypothetical protein